MSEALYQSVLRDLRNGVTEAELMSFMCSCSGCPKRPFAGVGTSEPWSCECGQDCGCRCTLPDQVELRRQQRERMAAVIERAKRELQRLTGTSWRTAMTVPFDGNSSEQWDQPGEIEIGELVVPLPPFDKQKGSGK